MSVSNSNPHVHVKFAKNELVNGVVLYTIEVTYLLNDSEFQKSKKVWTKRTRYSALLLIHQRCKEIVRSSIPEFPPKKWFGNTDSKFVEMRQTALQNYFNILLKFVKLDQIPPLKSFLFEGVDLNAIVDRRSLPPKMAEPEFSIQANEKKSLPANINSRKGDIVVDLKDKFIEIGHTINMPEDDEKDKKREFYSKKLKSKFQSQLLERLVCPQGSEKNLSVLRKRSLNVRDSDFIQEMDERVLQITRRIEKHQNYLFASSFVHLYKN